MAFVPRNNEIHSRHPTCALGDCASAPSPSPSRTELANCNSTVNGLSVGLSGHHGFHSVGWLVALGWKCTVLAAPKLQAFHSFLDPFTNPHPQVNNTPHGHFNGKLWGRLIFNESTIISTIKMYVSGIAVCLESTAWISCPSLASSSSSSSVYLPV